LGFAEDNMSLHGSGLSKETLMVNVDIIIAIIIFGFTAGYVAGTFFKENQSRLK